MGLYQSIYIGPYLVVSKKIVESVKEEVICTSDTCRGNTNSKFCPNCGEPTKIIERPIKNVISAFNIVSNEFEDEMYIPDLDTKDDILLPNRYDGRPFKINIDSDRGSSSIYSLRELDRESDINWLTDKYNHIIRRLKEEFDSVQVDWGIIVSWN